jgi:hypothetical protein
MTPAVRIMRSGERTRTGQPGISSWHCFSAGPHYDPDNLAFGPIVGVDEHLVAGGAGFDWHGHRGVQLASWVLAGALRHEDSGGDARTVRSGVLLHQSTGDGIRHREGNASGTEPLRFLQVTVLGSAPAAVGCPELPARVGDVEVDRATGWTSSGPAFVFVLDGEFALEGVDLRSGDSVRWPGERGPAASGSGELLVLRLRGPTFVA